MGHMGGSAYGVVEDAEPFDQQTMHDVRAIQRAWGDWKIYG